MKQTKQVIVMPRHLKVRRGKEIAQGSHSSVGCILNLLKKNGNKLTLDLDEHPEFENWINESRHTKICLQCTDEKEMMELYNKAKQAKLNCIVITDAGLTEFNGIPTKTCLAIGPNYVEDIDKITGHLKPY